MNKFRLLLFFLFFSTIVLGQEKHDSTKTIKTEVNSSQSQVSLNLPDTIQIKDTSLKNNSKSFLETNLPWLVALFIGVLSAVVNFLIFLLLRRSNEINLERQIKSNERIIESQIKSARETSLIEFKATMGTKNRQEWINELRHTLCEFLTISFRLTPDKIGEINQVDYNKYMERVGYSKAKIELLTNEDKPEHKELLNAIDKFVDLFKLSPNDLKPKDIVTARNNIIKSARNLLKLQWQKIKDLK